MTKAETQQSKSRRILVALDNSARGQAALAAAVRLALKTRAELQGLYVEDERQQRAGLFLRDVAYRLYAKPTLTSRADEDEDLTEAKEHCLYKNGHKCLVCVKR